MNGSEHYREGERLLSDASFIGADGPVRRDGTPFTFGEHRALVDRAAAHFAAAEAAATALAAVLPLVGGDSTEVTAWARMIGALDESAEPDDVVQAVIYPEHWPPMAGDVWANWNSRWFAQRVPEAIQMVPAYTGSDLSPEVTCSPEELLKRDSSLTLVSREEPPF